MAPGVQETNLTWGTSPCPNQAPSSLTRFGLSLMLITKHGGGRGKARPGNTGYQPARAPGTLCVATGVANRSPGRISTLGNHLWVKFDQNRRTLNSCIFPKIPTERVLRLKRKALRSYSGIPSCIRPRKKIGDRGKNAEGARGQTSQ